MSISLKILGIPQSKQSARFRISKNKAGKSFISSYQKKEVKDNEKNLAFDIKSQLPNDFIPFNGPLEVEVLFVFPPLKSFTKTKMSELEAGNIIYKDTKPDLTDNLCKGLFDAMQGIVMVDDSRVSVLRSKKIFGLVPRTELIIKEL